MNEQYLLDDDLHEIFCTKQAGARLYVIADSLSFRLGREIRICTGPARQRAVEGTISSAVRLRSRQSSLRAGDRPRDQYSGPDEAALSRRCSSRGARTPSSATTRLSIGGRTARSRASRSTRCRMRTSKLAAGLARRVRKKLPRTVTAADPTAVWEPRRQAGSLVLMTVTHRARGRKHTRVSGMGRAVLSLRPLQPARRDMTRSSPPSMTFARSEEARRCPPPCISTSSPAPNASRCALASRRNRSRLGTVNSGDPETLEQFLLWAFDACPARRYVLVMAGLGIMDCDSVVGRPPFDAARLFAICDDRATNDAIELHEFSATLKACVPGRRTRDVSSCSHATCTRCSSWKCPTSSEACSISWLASSRMSARNDAPLLHWPYARCLQRWQEIVATPTEAKVPRWRSAVDPQGLMLAKETVAVLAEHYTSNPAKGIAGHGVGDQSGGARPCRAGARYVQRRLSSNG